MGTRNRKADDRPLPKDKPKSYDIEHAKEVRKDVREKLAQNPQKEREKKELNEDKLEQNPDSID